MPAIRMTRSRRMHRRAEAPSMPVRADEGIE
jgi:hypothetical protein